MNFEWVDDLVRDNKLVLLDVAIDIKKEMQLSDKIRIPILQTFVKFAELFPADSARMRDRYCEERWKAIEFLKTKGVIKSHEYIEHSHRWDSTVEIVPVKQNIENLIADLIPLVGEEMSVKPDAQIVESVFDKFQSVVVSLGKRRTGRAPLLMNDEYDVQYLLGALLSAYYKDVRPEEWAGSFAGKSSRADFLIRDIGAVVEAKMTRDGLGQKEIGEQLILDAAKYREFKEVKRIYFFIYDPSFLIQNRIGLETDIAKLSTEIKVKAYVSPRM